MKKNIFLQLIVAVVYSMFFVVPVFAEIGAGSPSSGLLNSGTTVSTLITSILQLFGSLVPVLVGAAVIFFLYGVFIFIAKSSMGNAEGRAEGIKFMIFGIIGIAVMVSVWGLVIFVTNTLGTTTAIPQFKAV